MTLQRIEIDFDIHKLIEAERRGFDEPPYIALRRLLGLSQTALHPHAHHAGKTQESASQGKPFVEEGVEVPHGSRARMSYLYGRQTFEGQFLDGYLVVGGDRFSSLSAAASALAVTKDGLKTSLNGWKYWEVQFPGKNDWVSLDKLRIDKA